MAGSKIFKFFMKFKKIDNEIAVIIIDDEKL